MRRPGNRQRQIGAELDGARTLIAPFFDLVITVAVFVALVTCCSSLFFVFLRGFFGSTGAFLLIVGKAAATGTTVCSIGVDVFVDKCIARRPRMNVPAPFPRCAAKRERLTIF